MGCNVPQKKSSWAGMLLRPVSTPHGPPHRNPTWGNKRGRRPPIPARSDGDGPSPATALPPPPTASPSLSQSQIWPAVSRQPPATTAAPCPDTYTSLMGRKIKEGRSQEGQGTVNQMLYVPRALIDVLFFVVFSMFCAPVPT
jgi:hypothetical protein